MTKKTADLVTSTEEILYEKLHFLCSVSQVNQSAKYRSAIEVKFGKNPLIIIAIRNKAGFHITEIRNSRVAKSRNEIKLHLEIESHLELLTRKFVYKFFFRVINSTLLNI